ncbi:SH3 domain-containing protein [Streptomyces alfalfae]|nr:SH3 domain-containing protein [Streptomyces fradiae]RXX34762.1 SH3 domain-containing protein [Streptomyces alfalfae]RZM91539.1 SH3 domain-containing protein [Streptomyces alfalfae]
MRRLEGKTQMMVRYAVSGCAAVALASVATTSFAQADAGSVQTPSVMAPRASLTPDSVKQGGKATVRLDGAPRGCRSVQARSDAFVRTVTLTKRGNPSAHLGRALVKGTAVPGRHQVTVSGTGCGRWVAGATLTVVSPAKTVKGKVIARTGLKVRQQPNSDSAVTGFFRSGEVIDLTCRKMGQPVGGNRTWYQVSMPKGYVAARYVKPAGPVPQCR